MLNCHRMPAAWDWGEWQGTSKSSAWHWVLLPWCRWRQMPEYCYTVKNAEQSDFIKRIQGGIKHPPFLLFWPFLFVLLFHAGIIGSRLTRGSMKNESVSVYSSVVVVHQSVLRWLRYPLHLCEKNPCLCTSLHLPCNRPWHLKDRKHSVHECQTDKIMSNSSLWE